MFSELVESVAPTNSKAQRWALVVSVTLQAACLLILIIVPLIYTQALPKAILNTALVALPGASSQPATPLPKGGARGGSQWILSIPPIRSWRHCAGT